jgi:hypothetical protein
VCWSGEWREETPGIVITVERVHQERGQLPFQLRSSFYLAIPTMFDDWCEKGQLQRSFVNRADDWREGNDHRSAHGGRALSQALR